MSESTATARSAEPAEPDQAAGAAESGEQAGGAGGRGSHLFRNAYALMVNTGVSAVLGLGYWAVAARYYSEEAVGQGSAAIAAMKFLAGLTAVTLIGALARFIPTAGRHTRGLIVRTYAASSALVALAAVIFLLTLDLWGPSYGFLRGWLPGLGFVVAVVAWALMTLQDGVLTGLRSATWVPVGNTVFSAAKLGLLVLLAAAVPTAGVFVSWAAAIALSVLPLGWLVFRRLVPRHTAATRDTARTASYREIGRFLAGDYTGALFSLAVVYLVPVLVATQVSSVDNAYFYITITIAGTVNLLAINMGASLTVEGSHDPAQLAANCRASLRRMARIMLPISAVLFVFAPQILGVFGPGYAEAATPLLRWYAVGALLRVVIEVYYAVLRAQSRTSGLAYLQGLLCVLVLGLTVALLPPLGLTGAGIAEVASLGLVAAVAVLKLRGVLKGPTREQVPPDGDLADLAADGIINSPARRQPPWRRYPETVLWGLLGFAVTLYWLPLRGMGDADLDAMGGLGLISVLPVTTLVGGALLVVCFAGALRLSRPPRVLLATALLLTVVSLHAVPAVLEAEPRFATAWQHLGFLDYIDRTGVAAPELDARWSWPGFFAGAAFVAQAAGVQDLTEVIRWWPLLIQLLFLAPLALLLRAVRASWRARWCAAWFFVLCGWVGQDYFSPQGFTYLLYLCFAAILLVWFRQTSGAGGTGGAGKRSRAPGEAAVPDVGRRTRAVLLAVLLVLFTASVAGHQLTPFVMLGVVTLLVLLRRCDLRGLPLLCGVLVAVWIGFLAEPYWSGHFDELFGGIGGVGGNVSSSVSGRIEGGSETHKLVLYTRVALAGGTLALAAWGVWRRRRAGYSDRALLVLAAVPFLAFGAQSYGGEIALRVFLFAVPGACVLAALALFPHPSGRPRRARPWAAPVAALLAGLILLGGFLIARWGNETFERVRPGEVAAMEYVYEHDRPTARLLWLSSDPEVSVTPSLPWGARDMERVWYEPVLAPRDPERAGALVDALREAGPNSYLIVNRGQSAFLELDAGYAPDWEARLRAELDGRAELRRAYGNEDAALYELRDPPTTAVPEPVDGPAGPLITWTVWTAAGALGAVLLIGLLTVREVVRVLGVPGPRRDAWMLSGLWFALPLMLLVLGSLAQRLWSLS